MKNIKRQKNLKSQRGASLVEYGMLVSLIAIAGIPALTKNGQKVGLRLCQAATDTGRADFNVTQGQCNNINIIFCPFNYRVSSGGGNSYSCLRN